MFEEENAASIGVVIRDEKGHVMASLAEKIFHPNSVAIVETMAAVKAFTFAQDIGLSYLILEGDSEIVINVLKNKDKAKTLS